MLEPTHRRPAGWPRAIVFDLDGTLIDSAPDIASAAEQALADYGLSIDAERARSWLGDGARQLIVRALASAGAQADAARIDRLTARFSSIYERNPCEHTTLYPGAMTTLGQLRDAGIGLAICTNKPHEIANRVIRSLALDDYVDTWLGGGKVPLKPAPDGILRCLDTLQSAVEQGLYVGDMAVDRQAGHAAGLPVLLATFGYAGDRVVAAGADGFFAGWDTFDEAVEQLRTPPAVD